MRQWLTFHRIGGRAPSAPFGRSRFGGRVLSKVIDGAVAVGCRVPARVAHALALVGGHVEWALRPSTRRRLATNLAHALERAPSDRVVRNAVRRELVNEARRSADLLWSLGKPHEFLSTVVVDGIEHAQDALARGRGLILAGIHLGGWEVATALPSAVLQTPVSVIVADDWLAWGIEHRRVAGGLRVLYRDRAALAATRVLRNGEVLLLLGDDGWGDEPRTHRVGFLDADADLPAGIVALSRVCGAPIVTFTVLPLAPRRWKASIDRIIEPPPRDGGAAAEQQTLQVLADRWSAVVRAHPDHWAARHRIRWQERA